MRSALLTIGIAALLTGCGSSKQTVVTVVDTTAIPQATGAPGAPTTSPATTGAAAAAPAGQTTTTPGAPATAAPSDAAKAPDAQFCQGAPGNTVRKASADAMTAFNKSKPTDFSKAVDSALGVSGNAPPGSACVKDALNGMVALAQTGGSNLHGLDTKAVIKRIHAFEDQHQIDHP